MTFSALLGLTLLLVLMLLWLASDCWRLRRELKQNTAAAQRFRVLWQRLPDVITEIDRDGRILDVNHLLSGFAMEDVVGQLCENFLPEDQAENFRSCLSTALRNHTPQTFEITLRDQNNHISYLKNQLIPVMVSRELQSLLVISTDITEQKRARDLLTTEKEQAQEANIAKSRFLASMSHEIRTPMTGLLGMVSLLEQTPLTSEQMGFVRIIQSSSEHLLTIVNDILDISKIDADKLTIEEENFNVREMIDSLIAMMSAKAREKHLSLQFFVEESVPQYVIGDAVRIRQILMNYLSNALKFTEVGHVLLRLVVVRRQFSQVQLRFSVEDSGIGIAADRALHLFDEYSVAHGRLSTLVGGTGLGLSICRRLAALMHGKVGVISSPGSGSNFWLDLNLTVAACDLPEAMVQAATAAYKLDVWVCDDVQINRALLVSVVRRLGGTIREFSVPLDLFDALPAGQPDILVVPHNLFNRYQQELRERLGNARTHLALTATDSVTVTEAEWLALGVNAFWDWPISQEHLQQLLLRLMNEGGQGQLITRFGRRSGEPAAGDHELKGKRILLAEDNLVNQKVATQMLARLGCEVTVAANGQEAVQLYQTQRFDLVLMDCHMPVMDGLEATRRIRSSTEQKHIPVIALSADVMAEQKAACLQAGMNGYLSKPIRLDELRQALCGFLRPDQSALP
ncbi:MAG: response regulator [Saccharospirillaceae bacterium]|nr:response regulator [Saccharospirillaceae bacterium]MCD8531062.1 response regulator [Saccharospirillaceae bacterium]